MILYTHICGFDFHWSGWNEFQPLQCEACHTGRFSWDVTQTFILHGTVLIQCLIECIFFDKTSIVLRIFHLKIKYSNLRTSHGKLHWKPMFALDEHLNSWISEIFHHVHNVFQHSTISSTFCLSQIVDSWIYTNPSMFMFLFPMCSTILTFFPSLFPWCSPFSHFFHHFSHGFHHFPLFSITFSHVFHHFPIFSITFSMVFSIFPIFPSLFPCVPPFSPFSITFSMVFTIFPFFPITFPHVFHHFPLSSITFPMVFTIFPFFPSLFQWFSQFFSFFPSLFSHGFHHFSIVNQAFSQHSRPRRAKSERITWCRPTSAATKMAEAPLSSRWLASTWWLQPG